MRFTPVPMNCGTAVCGSNPSERAAYSQFWYVIYHALFWLDLYLSGAVEGFAPPPPFTLDELDPAGLLPERPFTIEELQAYLAYGRSKCQATIAALTAETAYRRCRFTSGRGQYCGAAARQYAPCSRTCGAVESVPGAKWGFCSRLDYQG